MSDSKIYLALGGNLDNPIAQLKRAIGALRLHPDIEVTRASSFYSSSPMGPVKQNDFVNAVVEAKTNLSPNELLKTTQTIEQQQGRIRTSQQWGPRTLDIDILLYSDIQTKTAELTLPHPGLTERDFVLVPLAEIAPGLVLPDGTRIMPLISRCASHDLQRITANEPAEIEP